MLKSVFALCWIALFAAFAVRSHYAAMLMYWWFGIFRPHEWMWWDVSSLRLPLVAALIFVVPMLVQAKFPRSGGGLVPLLIGFTVLVGLSGQGAGCEFPFPSDRVTIVVLMVVTLLSASLMNSRPAITGLLVTVTFSLCFKSSKAGINSLLNGSSLYGLPIGGGSFTGTNAVALGSAMACFMLLVLWQLLAPIELNAGAFSRFFAIPLVRRVVRSILLIAIFGAALFVIRSESRGSALSLGVGLLFWMLLQPQRMKVLTIAAVLGTLTFFIVPAPEGYSERIMSVFAEDDDLDRSASSRPHFWNTAFIMADNHAFGVGIGCFQSYYDGYDSSGGEFGSRRSVHSSHYSILAEVGYIGFLCWVGLLSLTAYRLWGLRRRSREIFRVSADSWFTFHLANALLATVLVYALGGSFYEVPYSDYIWIIFAMVIAMSNSAKEASASGTESRARSTVGGVSRSGADGAYRNEATAAVGHLSESGKGSKRGARS